MGGQSIDKDVSLARVPLHSGNFFILVDPDGRIRHVSPAVEEVLGYDQSELIDERLTEKVHPNDRELVADMCDGLDANSETTVGPFEYRYERADGSYAGLRSVCSAESTADGQYILNTTAVSKLEAVDETSTGTTNDLDEFAKVVSHDLRNPLSVASGYAELLYNELEDDPERDHLERVISAHQRMDALIQDLLTLAQIGTQIHDTEWVEFPSLCETCWENVSTADATLNVTVNGEIQADPSRLKQLLENLIRNAVNHGGESVTVTIGDMGEQGGFYVSDTGVGIDEASRDRVFESGFSTTDDGTGFGLAIVSEIVDAHGWEITVTESDSGGARFEITNVERRGDRDDETEESNE